MPPHTVISTAFQFQPFRLPVSWSFIGAFPQPAAGCVPCRLFKLSNPPIASLPWRSLSLDRRSLPTCHGRKKHLDYRELLGNARTNSDLRDTCYRLMRLQGPSGCGEEARCSRKREPAFVHGFAPVPFSQTPIPLLNGPATIVLPRDPSQRPQKRGMVLRQQREGRHTTTLTTK